MYKCVYNINFDFPKVGAGRVNTSISHTSGEIVDLVKAVNSEVVKLS